MGKNKSAGPLWLLALLIIIGCLYPLLQPPTPGRNDASENPPAADLPSVGSPSSSKAQIRAVIDGDSLLATSGKAIRLLGIDAPETGQPYAREAKAYLKKLVADKPLTLIHGNVKQDKYERLLAHIILDQDGRTILVSEALLRRGLAHMYIIPPDFLFLDRLRAAQTEAIDGGRGIWQVPVKSSPVYVVSAWKFHRPDCPHVKAIMRPKQSSNRTDILKSGKSPCRTCQP